MKDAFHNMHDKSTNVRTADFRRHVILALFAFSWRWAPGLARWVVLRLFFTPSAYRTNSVEKDCLRQGSPFQFQTRDNTIKGWKWGHGPAVLLVHGWNGRGIQFHGFVEPLVQAGYTAIAIDGPAHGESTGCITSYFEFTDMVRSLLSEDRGFGIMGIIAHSFGAAAAINAMAKEGLALNMVLVSPVLRLSELLFKTFDRFGIPNFLYTSLIGEFETRFGYSLTADNPYRLIGGLSGSALIVHDKKDRTVNFSDSNLQARKHGNISLYATDGLGHRRILTDPTVIQRSVAFMGQLDINVASAG
jgi:pimeloyl-ACP methyl ester carboxylesterase